MSQGISLKEIERKTFAGCQGDGLVELVLGLCLAAFAAPALSSAFVLVFVLCPVASRPILRGLRNRFTYPRIGRAELTPEEPKEGLRVVVLALAVVAVMALAFIFFGDVRDIALWFQWLPAFGGTLMAGLFLFLASKSGFARHYGFALASVAAGVLLSIRRFTPPESGLFVYFLAMGVLLALSGLVLFLKFLRSHPLPAEEAPHVHS